LGARVLERHITLDRSAGGLDAGFSTTASEFKEIVKQIRELEQGLGVVTFDLSESGVNSRRFSRSLFIVKDVKAGERVTTNNVRSIRPNDGLPPKFLPEVLNQTFKIDVPAGTPLSLEVLY